MNETPSLRAISLSLEHEKIWRRLLEFRFDSHSDSRFSNRIALEHGWTITFADRVVTEYLRFLLLTAVAGHAICPSEDVDAVWHQHLTFSRSYWNDLCQQTLGFPLHHDPSQGGSPELQKHWTMYEMTLASYRRVFCEEPPPDIWPPAFKRFDRHSRPRQVNLRDYWVLRKPVWWPTKVRRPIPDLLDHRQRVLARGIPCLAMFILLAFGIAKVIVGMNRDRPVALLLVCCIGVAVAIVLLGLPVRRTLEGDRLVKYLKSQYHYLKSGLRIPEFTPRSVMLGIGLFGPVAIDGMPIKNRNSPNSTSTAATNGGESYACSNHSCGGNYGCGAHCGGTHGCASGCGGCSSLP